MQIWDCQYCHLDKLCRGEVPPTQRYCVNCTESTIEKDGMLSCAGISSTRVKPLEVCKDHRFTPGCVPGVLCTDGSYQLDSGMKWWDNDNT